MKFLKTDKTVPIIILMTNILIYWLVIQIITMNALTVHIALACSESRDPFLHAFCALWALDP